MSFRFPATLLRMHAAAILAGLLAAGTCTAQDTRTPAINEFSRLIVTGDGKAALAALTAVPEQARTPREARLTECVSNRFAASVPETMPPGLADKPAAWRILQIYRSYWRASLTRALGEDAAKARLLAGLNAVLPAGEGWDHASLDEASTRAKAYLESLGLHAITGVTRPYYELMLWTEQSERDYRVDLSDQVVTVPVSFMDGFASRGWLHYATCDWFGAGGWTANGHLYAIRSSYDLDSEDFRVSYLGHEGRHFADNRAFPKLDQAELEYRAKLTELVLSRTTTRTLFDQFVRSAHQGRAAPHTHAEYWLARHMQAKLFPGSAKPLREEAWASIGDGQLRSAAAAPLAASTAQAAAAGPALEKLLPD